MKKILIFLMLLVVSIFAFASEPLSERTLICSSLSAMLEMRTALKNHDDEQINALSHDCGSSKAGTTYSVIETFDDIVEIRIYVNGVTGSWYTFGGLLSK